MGCEIDLSSLPLINPAAALICRGKLYCWVILSQRGEGKKKRHTENTPSVHVACLLITNVQWSNLAVCSVFASTLASNANKHLSDVAEADVFMDGVMF